MTDERAAYVALALTPGIGQQRMALLLDRFETASGALSAPFAFLCTTPTISSAAATAIHAATPADGHRILEAVDQLGGRCLIPADAEFPAILTQIPDPPTILFVRGDLGLLTRPAVAIVGSRDHSSYGAEVCRAVALGVARRGIVVVSGLARGLDAVAHTGALDAGGGTIGVLGNGLDQVYPAANRELYERVIESGLLLTEFAPGDRPHAGSFPRRNRIISGLSRVVVVIEAAAGSGTLITVDTALAQGREVMAVPGNITSPTSEGTNRLIRDGATPLLELDDLLRQFPELAPAMRSKESLQLDALAPPPLPPDASPEEVRILEQLGGGACHVDDLAGAIGLPAGHLLASLVALELRGHVVPHPGGRFGRS